MTIYIFLLLFLGQCIYIQKPRNSIQHVSIAKVGPWDFFVSIHIIWEFTRCGLREKTELLILSICFMLIGNGKVLRLYTRSFTAACMGGKLGFSGFPPLWEEENWKLQLYRLSRRRKLDFPVFLRSERWKTGNCSFTAAPVGGKLDFPVFLRSERRKTGNRSFTAAPIGGKVDFPVFLRSERRTGNCTYAAGTCVGDLSIRFFNPLFPSFACWWVMGRGVVPQNEGRTCVNNDWVK